MIQFCNLISLLHSNNMKKKKKSYFFSTQFSINFLNNLWAIKLIWGYKIQKKFVTVFMKYYLNKPTINHYTIYRTHVSLQKLKWLTIRNPQSIFVLKTVFGYKNQYYCLYSNIGGIIVLKIN